MRRILIAGAGGFVGAHLWPRLARQNRVVVVSRKPLTPLPAGVVARAGDLEDERFTDDLARGEPDADVVVYLAGVTDAQRAQREPELAFRSNVEAPERLARALSRRCRRFVFVSTDLVFDGAGSFYRESDVPRPLSVYGRTKLEGERAVRAVLGDRSVTARLALVYGARNRPESRESFAERMVRAAAAGNPVDLFTDEIRTPVYVEDAAESLSRLVDLDEAPGVVHLGGPERLSRFEMGMAVLAIFDLPAGLARPCLAADAPSLAPRPKDVSLDIALGASLGLVSCDVRVGIARMKRAMERRGFMVGS
jgi:dTDP-4-dehydrorhamnose reductase